MNTVTCVPDIHVVPDTPGPATLTVTYAELAVFYQAGVADGIARALAGS